MSETSRRSVLSAWGLLFLGLFGLVAMAIFMMRDTGDVPYQAIAEVTVFAGPGSDEAVVETLLAGAVLKCHGEREGQSGWLDCSDIMERKYIPAESMQPISDEAYREARGSQPPSKR